jgi:hypothetical protein
MRRDRPALFKGRHFEPEIIILCVRRSLRYALNLRNLEEIMAERSVHVDHVTIWRWIQRYAPELSRRCRPELGRTNGSWRVAKPISGSPASGPSICRTEILNRARSSITNWPGFERLIEPELMKAGAPVVLAGDYNVVPTVQDIYRTRSLDNTALIQPKSRQAYARLLADGWTDALRKLQPGGDVLGLRT